MPWEARKRNEWYWREQGDKILHQRLDDNVYIVTSRRIYQNFCRGHELKACHSLACRVTECRAGIEYKLLNIKCLGKQTD